MNEQELFAENEVYNEETNSLVRRIEGDIAYIDPPYTVTQYVSAYHMLDTIAKYDSPNIKGVGGKRGRGNKNSLYAQRTKWNVNTKLNNYFKEHRLVNSIENLKL